METPGPGEYRYLRLAWKTPEGSGVMLELADNGNWPDAGDARRRIYSGKNTTDWKATQISREPLVSDGTLVSGPFASRYQVYMPRRFTVRIRGWICPAEKQNSLNGAEARRFVAL